MSVYRHERELGDRTLKRGDIVCFCDGKERIQYEVRRNKLMPVDRTMSISRILRLVYGFPPHIDDVNRKATRVWITNAVGKIYGYAADDDAFPDCKCDDFEALTRMAKEIWRLLRQYRTTGRTEFWGTHG